MENGNENAVVIYDLPRAITKAHKYDYTLTIGEKNIVLKRDVDFGKVPKAKVPSLWKSGAEKVLMSYGLYYDVEMVDSYKDYKNAFFYYECKAIAYDQNGRVVRVGYGCANTNESSNGSASGFNTANSAIKKARKRAIVDLALTMGSLSDAFTQDLESDITEEQSTKVLGDNDPITPKQAKRIFAIASTKEITREKAKDLLRVWGFDSTKDITQKDYDEVVDKLEKYEEK